MVENGTHDSNVAEGPREGGAEPVFVSDNTLDCLLELYDQGLFLQAYQQAVALGPLECWEGPRARLFAARLAGQVGSDRRRAAWIWKLHRRYPDYEEAFPYFAAILLTKFGPWRAWRWMNDRGELSDEVPSPTRAYWWCTKADVMAAVRDFDRAEQYVAQALQVDPDYSWVHLTRAVHLVQEDRYEEAAELVDQLLTARPWFPAAVHLRIDLLLWKQQDEQAWQLAREADQHIESYAVTQARALIEWEQKRWDELVETVELLERRAPLADRSVKQWLSMMHFEINYHRGDYEAARQVAEHSQHEYVRRCAERLADAQHAQLPRVELPVGFVRQHHVTCGPATLAAISHYWNMPVDHLKIAEQICYDGTSNYHERQWAESHGWYVREFSVTEQAARDLLDRGIPFTLTTVEPNSAHLQAVIGYDGRLGTLQIRDPYHRPTNDAVVDVFLSHYFPFGPRGMALVPMAERQRLEGLELPDTALWDLLHEMDDALERHDRTAAQQAIDRMQHIDHQHRLTRIARIRLAQYDGNPFAAADAVNSLVEEFSNNPTVLTYSYRLCSSILPQTERLIRLRKWCQQHRAQPIFWELLTTELTDDAQGHEEAHSIIKKLFRRGYITAEIFHKLAILYGMIHQWEKAFELSRWAACLKDTDEGYAHTYFSIGCVTNRVDEVLDFLVRRFERYGRQSSWPARSLISAYQSLDRAQEAAAVLERALQLRGDDGELLLFAARFWSAWGDRYRHRVHEYLQQAESRVAADAYLRTVAALAEEDGCLSEALKHWRSLLSRQPLCEDAYRAVARLLAATDGPTAALCFLQEAVERYPHFQPLQRLWVEWTRDEPAAERERWLRRLTELAPRDGWLHTELAACLAAQQRWQEAWHAAEQAERYTPHLFLLPCVKARILQGQNHTHEARQELRRAIMASANNSQAIEQLLDSHTTPTGLLQELPWVFEQLRRQVVSADSVVAYFEQAKTILQAAAYSEQLAEAQQARPDLWQVGYLVVEDHLHHSRWDEAERMIHHLTDRFPLVPPLWLQRARIARLRHDPANERAALENAYRLAPRSPQTVLSWVAFHERQGQRSEAFSLLEQAALRCPLDAAIQLAWAEALWDHGRHDEAIQRALHVVRFEPGEERAWDNLWNWCRIVGRTETVADELRSLTRERAGELRSWLLLARVLDQPEFMQERLEAIDRALQLAPYDVDVHLLRAEILASAGHWPEAEAACQPPVFAGELPYALRQQLALLKFCQRDLETARNLLQELATEQPRDTLTWYYLHQVAKEAGDQGQTITAAEKLVELMPHDAAPLTLLANAYVRAGDRQQALELLRRALTLCPDAVDTAKSLAALLLELNQLDEVRQVLNAIEPHDVRGLTTTEYLEWARRSRSKALAIERFRHLLETMDADPDVMRESVNIMNAAGWRKECCRLLEEALRRPFADLMVGRLWAHQKVVCRQWDCEPQLLQLQQRGRLGVYALRQYVESLLNPRHPWRIRCFLRRYQHQLLEHSHGWACVLRLLLAVGKTRAAVDLAERWRSFHDLRPWMLQLAATAFFVSNRFPCHNDVLHYAITLPPDETTPLIYLRLAAMALWDDDFNQAHQYWQYARPSLGDPLTEYYSMLVALMLKAALVEEDSPERKVKFLQIWKQLPLLRAQYNEQIRLPDGRKAYYMVLGYLRREDRSLSGWWQWLRAYLQV